MRNVCNSALVADEVFCTSIVKVLIKNAIKSFYFVLVALCRVLMVVFRIAQEVVGLMLKMSLPPNSELRYIDLRHTLTLHRPYAGVLKEQPIVHLSTVFSIYR